MTSSLGGTIKKDGKRVSVPMSAMNGFLGKLQREWVDKSKVMIIAGTPDDYEINDSICKCCRQSFEMSGLKDKLKEFEGLIIAWSAGSMNCADIVYASPEMEGEAFWRSIHDSG